MKPRLFNNPGSELVLKTPVLQMFKVGAMRADVRVTTLHEPVVKYGNNENEWLVKKRALNSIDLSEGSVGINRSPKAVVVLFVGEGDYIGRRVAA